jgi:hypothetical protein
MIAEYDPSLLREQRRADAKRSAANVSPERLLDLQSKYGSKRGSTRGPVAFAKLPATADDPLPELRGSHDLVYPIHDLADHRDGPDNDWLFLTVFPRGLRARGWIYVKAQGAIRARVRVVGVGFRTNVHEHTPDEAGAHAPVASTATLELDSTTWELLDVPAAVTHQQGFRYLDTDEANGVITHLVDGAELSSHNFR